MINGVHLLLYADDPVAARAFFRDVLGWPHVEMGGDWLIFKTRPAELGIHPTGETEDGSTPQHHEVSLMCDDVQATVAELRAKGVVFNRDVRDDGWGLTTAFEVPGAGEMMLYQPRHPLADTL